VRESIERLNVEGRFRARVDKEDLPFEGPDRRGEHRQKH
jgi:hypothetical protein